jgi:hypothetical protein
MDGVWNLIFVLVQILRDKDTSKNIVCMKHVRKAHRKATQKIVHEYPCPTRGSKLGLRCPHET